MLCINIARRVYNCAIYNLRLRTYLKCFCEYFFFFFFREIYFIQLYIFYTVLSNIFLCCKYFFLLKRTSLIIFTYLIPSFQFFFFLRGLRNCSLHFSIPYPFLFGFRAKHMTKLRSFRRQEALAMSFSGMRREQGL